MDKLLSRYFSKEKKTPLIEVFDSDNIYDVYSHIVKLLTGYVDIEVSVLQALSYCFYEILDNVLTHSGKLCGTTIQSYDAESNRIKVLVGDDGVGILNSLQENPEYANLEESDALRLCVKDKVTDGKGMGFGLYSTFRLVKLGGLLLEIHSGTHKLTFDGKDVKVLETDYWHGTLVFVNLFSDKEIDPNEVVEYRTDCEDSFIDNFIDDKLSELW